MTHLDSCCCSASSVNSPFPIFGGCFNSQDPTWLMEEKLKLGIFDMIELPLLSSPVPVPFIDCMNMKSHYI